MFKYRVIGLCEKTVSETLNAYSSELTSSQMRKRARESFATLKTKLGRISSIVEIIEQAEQASATVFATNDISEHLRKEDIFAIELDEQRKFPVGSQYLFYIRATSGITTEQEKISRIIYEEFGGSKGPYPFTYFVAGDPDSRWLPNPFDRNNDWLMQLRKIEKSC